MCGTGLSACGTGGGATAAAFCALVKNDDQKFKHFAGTKDAAQQASKAMKELAGKAPSEMKSDMKTLSDTFEKVANGQAASARADATKFTAASKRLTAYAKDTCKLDLSAG